MGVPKEIFNRVTDADASLHQGGASDVEDALIAPSEAGSSAPVSRDPSPPNLNARRRIKTSRKSTGRVGDVRGLADSRVGVRAVRRKQNNQFLLALIEEEEEGLPELRDKPTVPAFTQLFLDKKNMMAWSEFISLPEERQEEYLKELNRTYEREEEEDEEDKEEETAKKEEDDRFPGDWELLDASAGAVSSSLTTRSASSVDARTWHPAMESSTSHPDEPTQPIPLPTQPMLLPEECFERVEMRFRAMLRKRHVPLGILANLEEDLTTFFTECPRSVWVSRLSSSYERLLLHALCQYLDLKSSSFDQDKARHTQVENHNLAFSPPRKSLHQHLEDMRLEKCGSSLEERFDAEEREKESEDRHRAEE